MVVRENWHNVKNVNGRAQQNRLILMIIDSFGGVMDKYNKHKILSPAQRGEGGGGTALYRLYRYVLRQRVWFF